MITLRRFLRLVLISAAAVTVILSFAGNIRCSVLNVTTFAILASLAAEQVDIEGAREVSLSKKRYCPRLVGDVAGRGGYVPSTKYGEAISLN